MVGLQIERHGSGAAMGRHALENNITLTRAADYRQCPVTIRTECVSFDGIVCGGVRSLANSRSRDYLSGRRIGYRHHSGVADREQAIVSRIERETRWRIAARKVVGLHERHLLCIDYCDMMSVFKIDIDASVPRPGRGFRLVTQRNRAFDFQALSVNNR